MMRAAAAILAAAFVLAARAAPPAAEKEIEALIEALRDVKPGQPAEVVRGYNKQMDAMWKRFDAERAVALPVVRARLANEVGARSPNPMILMDLALYLHLKGEPADRKLVADAVFRLDPKAPLVRDNQQALFGLVHALAEAGDARILPLTRDAFLAQKTSVAVPQHAMTLDSGLATAFIYGVYGKAGEAALREALADPALVRPALEALVWIGTVDSRAAVQGVLAKRKDYDTLVRGVSVLMTNGGPEGRDFVLALPVDGLDEKSRKYLADARKGMQAVDYAFLRSRLDAVARTMEKDDKGNPIAILDSGVPAAELIARLEGVRQATFRRVSDEALHDVSVTNQIIATIRYREKK